MKKSFINSGPDCNLPCLLSMYNQRAVKYGWKVVKEQITLCKAIK